jgi:hypothetical protein
MLVRAAHAKDGHDRSSKVAMSDKSRSGVTTIADHNEAGQRPIRADRKEVESQASDGNRQRARTLQAEGQPDPCAHLGETSGGSILIRLCRVTLMTLGWAFRRGPGHGPLPVELPVPRVRSWHRRGASLLVKRALRASVLLIIRRLWPPGSSALATVGTRHRCSPVRPGPLGGIPSSPPACWPRPP